MSPFTADNPVFTLYVLAAGLAILKMLGHAFLTVQRMVKVNSGFLNPEDTRRTLMNPNPSPIGWSERPSETRIGGQRG